MNKEQIRQHYQRFRQWQQESPHYVNRHQDTVQHCHNCGTEFTDNFCPRCGQRAELGRVGWNSIKENIAVLWGLDSRSLTYTLVQLLLRPGYLVRDYISGHRQVSFPPVKMLVIVSLFMVIIESVFNLKPTIGMEEKWDIPMIDDFIQWLTANKSWYMLFWNSFFILPTWVLFRFAPRYPYHTLPEGFFLQVFLSVQNLLLGFVDYFYTNTSSILNLIYTVITYRQLFGYGWWSTFWRIIIAIVTAILTMVLPIAVPYIFQNSQKSTEKHIFASAIFTLVVVLVIAVLLYISYRIGKRTRKV
ncbi:MAG: DUF3667 domain-containing protein [Prevotella sp.]|nr:DUF3667 domain-containing protein [Prevotella sp.]